VAVVASAWILRANRLVGVGLVWISNPLTYAPLFYFHYRVGCLLTGREAIGFENFPRRGEGVGWWDYVCDSLWQFLTPLAIGSIVVAIL
ncbi:MAG: DUF2062 domain-containing protein, partial [Planctomycetota bacterium]